MSSGNGAGSSGRLNEHVESITSRLGTGSNSNGTYHFWLGLVGGCLLFLLIYPIMLLLQGWVLQSLWGWYLVPLGISPIGLAHAIGVSMIVYFAAGSPKMLYVAEDEDTTGVEKILYHFTIPLWVWFVGWVLHFFV